MEGKRAQEFIYNKSVELGFFDLADHIKNVGTLKIQLSQMDFVSHLAKIIVGQQLSVQSAAAIWKRTKLILEKNKYKKINANLNISFKKAGLSRQKIEYLNGIIFNKDLLKAKKTELKKLSREEAKYLAQEKGAKIASTISKNTDFLIIGDKPGSKARKAKELNIQILSETEWIKKINQ